MPHINIYKQLLFPAGATKLLLITLICSLLVFGDALVENTGGTAFAYLHVLYIPIILAGVMFSIKGGLLAGIAAGLLMSPLLPTYIPHDLHQPFSSWGLRLVIFTSIGGLAGVGAHFLKAYIIELERKWTTNPITDLLNLHGLNQTFVELIQDKESPVIVLVCQLQHIEKVDRAFGEEKTNALIKSISQNLRTCVTDKGMLGHLEGHRFVILLSSEETLREVLRSCEALRNTSYMIENIPVFIETQFGIARYPKDDKDLTNLIRKAYGAIQDKKHEGLFVSQFDRNIDDPSEQNLFILSQLKKAIEEDTLFLNYQPKINLKSDEIIGFEAVVRWNDPLLGPISPAVFIPLAEETLLINSFTKWLLKAVIQQMAIWKRKGVLVPISFNLSVKNVLDPSLIETFIHLVEAHNIPSHFFEIEITETAITSHTLEIGKILRNLREFGVRISIDDYGTGQASQQYLFDLPITTIKVDKLFVDSISLSPTANAIVKNAIALAHDLQLEVIAEGIETEKQYTLLKKWKCDGGQGYFISRPLSADDAIKWMQGRKKTLAK